MTRNVWGRARFLLWLRIASTVLLGCCVIAGCLLYVALHPHGAGNSGPVGARQGRVAVLGGRRPARAPRAPARAAR